MLWKWAKRRHPNKGSQWIKINIGIQKKEEAGYSRMKKLF